jgi:hypothetical protein
MRRAVGVIEGRSVDTCALRASGYVITPSGVWFTPMGMAGWLPTYLVAASRVMKVEVNVTVSSVKAC